MLVVLNMSAEPHTVSFDLASQGFASSHAKTLLTTMPKIPGEVALANMDLAPFSVYIGE